MSLIRAALATRSWHQLLPVLADLTPHNRVEMLTQLLQERISEHAAWPAEQCATWPESCSRALARMLVQHQPAADALVAFCSSLQQQQSPVQLLQAASSCTSPGLTPAPHTSAPTAPTHA
jgi:hypothetical protein